MIRLPAKYGTPLPLAATTGSFWPSFGTAESLGMLARAGLHDIELTLQQTDFKMDFNRVFNIPILPHLLSLVREKRLTVCSLHAPHIHAEDGYSTKVRTTYLARSIELCRELGCRVLVTHPFHLFNSYESTIEYLSGSVSDVWQVLLPGVRELLRDAQAEGITLTVENVKLWADDDGGFFNAPENVERFLDDIDSPSLGLTLDIVHAQLAGTLESFVELLGSQVITAHIADLELLDSDVMIPPSTTDLLPRYRRTPPGKGRSPWSWILPALYALPRLKALTIELVNATQEDIMQSVDFMRSNWPAR